MRANGFITQLFVNGGPFIGENRPNGVVTVEKDWFLNKADVVGEYFAGSEAHVDRRNPVRWYQRADNSQVETNVPGVASINIDRNLTSDSASCEIVIINNKEKANMAQPARSAVQNKSHGDPGYLTFNRGETQNARDRWGFIRNEWHRVLQPGALLRTYEGYGGHDKELDMALVDGNLMQTGTWLVDDVSLTADGKLTLRCRDMAALLIDQLMYPELMPDACYPTQFYNDSLTSYNYRDISSIVALIALWAGFWCKDARRQPKIFGNIEQTGFTPDSPINSEFFDKRTCMDVINELKAIVGYITYVDQEGAFHFHSPNYWSKGNFFYNGKHTDTFITLDEKKNLLSYSANISKKNDRSDIYVSSSNPQLNIPGTKAVHHRWPAALPGESAGSYLRGMSQPMMIGVKVDMAQSEMNIMSQLVHLYMWFARRHGSAEIPGNPLIDINDQVQIFERTSSESFYHYVRGVNSTNDLQKGEYKMNLDTSWLGTAQDWAIVADGAWNIKYSDNTMYVHPDAYGPYREGMVVTRKAN